MRVGIRTGVVSGVSGTAVRIMECEGEWPTGLTARGSWVLSYSFCTSLPQESRTDKMRGMSGIPYPAAYKTMAQRISGREFQDACIYGATAVFIALWVLRLVWGRIAGLHRTTVKPEYDYIVVGAGAAGSVVANRLAMRGDKVSNVLLLEAGSDDSGHDMIYYPSYAWDLCTTAVDWCYKMAKNPALNDRDLSLPRGKVLGGTSAINDNLYQRPPKEELQQLGKCGVKGWGYDDCLKYFVKSEKSMIEESTPYHGFTGPLPVGFCTTRSPIGKLSGDSAFEAGVAKKFDANNPSTSVGVSPAQTMTDSKGMRCTPATSFVRPIMKEKNFTLRTEAHVTRVIFEGEKAVAVEWKDNLGMTHTTKCKGEVVLCAGAIGTPAILLRSGVQERNPAVGKNLRDLCTVPMIHQTRKGVSFDGNNIHSLMHTIAYRLSGSGPILSHPVDTSMYLDSNVHNVQVSWPDQKALEARPDKNTPKQMLAKAKNAVPDHFVTFANRGGFRRKEFAARKMSVQLGWFQEGMTSQITASQRGVAVPDAGCGSVAVDEKGEVTVDLCCLPDEGILGKMLPIIRMTRRIVAISPLRNILTQREAIDTTLLENVPAAEAGDILYGRAAARRIRFPKQTKPEEFEKLDQVHTEIDTDDYLVRYMKAHAQPFGTPVGTCSMAPLKSDDGEIPAAVDSASFMLRGASNVRVADASILPVPLLAPGIAMSLMIAERTADAIISS
eukprot:TRINITY_DN13805_c0_g2_i2.p1 TRINITY_DN13805_c0_g2~~TRINITY_DN13805_c0_g2_i2.p1  ORF type:complete len:724 (+),score=306.88 TRINITY_DN13805_c0_g2_i2:1519-3690(+)